MNRKEGIRIIFMGTPEFAVPSLEILVTNGYNIVAVITSTDKYGGRGGKQLLQSAIKKYALSHDIPVLQPKNLKSPAFIDELASFKADLQIVVAFRMLPEVVWNMPPLGTINLHGSLLPKYRGAAPINWAVINGENETGVTSFKLKHEIDTGDIILQEKLPIEPLDDAGSLHDKMKILGAKVVLKTVQLIDNDDVVFTKQDDSKLSKAPKIFHEDCKLDFDNYGMAIINKIRGLSPYPGAWIEHQGVEYKIYNASFENCTHNINPGLMITDNKSYWKVACKDGLILLDVIKKPGKQKMSIRNFLNGNTIL